MDSHTTFRFIKKEDTPEILKLFSKSFKRTLTAAYYDWHFWENPLLPGNCAVAEQQGKIVAHAGYTARNAQIASRPGVVFLKQTSMSDPAIRGTGIYSQLLEWAHKELASLGADLVLSYPNTANHPVQILRSDYTDIYQIPALIRKNSSTEHNTVKGSLSSCGVLASTWDSWTEAEKLGMTCTKQHPFALNRSAEYLKWRYALHPTETYRVTELRTGGDLKSLLIWKYYPRETPDRIMAVEWLSAPDDPGADKVFEELECHAGTMGLAIYTWQNVYGKVRYKALEKRGYKMAEPIIYFGAFPLTKKTRVAGYNEFRNWHIAMGDVDIF